jgi:ribulose-5-phosphate 4-epimerase/fuculose-1-phosphate aldolase
VNSVTDRALSRRLLINGLTAAAAMAIALPGRPAIAADPTPGEVEAAVIEELVTANRILSELELVDAFGHISRRHPLRPDHFLMSRARAPGLIEASDIMEFDAAGAPVDAQGRRPYFERFIHAAIYAARPDVNSVVHDHSEGVLPFTVASEPLRALSNAGGPLGLAVPVWDIRTRFGDRTNLLVSRLEIGHDLAKTLGKGSAVLMRGHGVVLAAPSIRQAVVLANAIERAARIQYQARQLGTVTYLSPGEVEQLSGSPDPSVSADATGRTWEFWCKKTGRPFHPKGY